MEHLWHIPWKIWTPPSLPSETLSKWQSLQRMFYFTLKYLVHKISGPVKCQSGFKVCCFMSPHQLKSKFYMKYFICHFSFQIVTTKVGVLLGLHLAKCKLCCDFVDSARICDTLTMLFDDPRKIRRCWATIWTKEAVEKTSLQKSCDWKCEY